MKCFKCRKDFDNVEQFLLHIQITHAIKGEMRCVCTLCFSIFGSFTKYKRHVQQCSKNGMVTNMDSYNEIIGSEINDHVQEFNDSLQKNVLLLILNMCAKPNLPRSIAFDSINEIAQFIKTLNDGTTDYFRKQSPLTSLIVRF